MALACQATDSETETELLCVQAAESAAPKRPAATCALSRTPLLSTVCPSARQVADYPASS